MPPESQRHFELLKLAPIEFKDHAARLWGPANVGT